MFNTNKCLSIQSHVVSGYVGNKCCILPLQILGNDVDFINSVQLSNHTHYQMCKGHVLNSSDLKDIHEGLKFNKLINYNQIITGYIGSKTFLEEVCNIVKDVKKTNSNAMFYCDPVMGDNGKMYVPAELLDVYRDQVVPLADVLFPNQYEAELLTGMKIKTEKDVLDAMDIFHNKGVSTVIMTSTCLGNENTIHGFVSQRLSDSTMRRLRLEIPRFPFDFVGTGDLFAALYLGWSIKCDNRVKEVCSKVIGCLQAVLRRTTKKYEALKENGFISESHALELCLVESVPDLMDPVSFNGIVEI